MPELTEESTPPTVAPPPTPEPPGDDPPDAPPSIPPIIDPARFEDFPVLRETFMLYVTDPEANATLRGTALLFFDLILHFWGDWPDPPEGMLRASLRAAVADLRAVQGFLAELEEGGWAAVTRSTWQRSAYPPLRRSALWPIDWKRSWAHGAGKAQRCNPSTLRGAESAMGTRRE